jgi:hypothetical protein
MLEFSTDVNMKEVKIDEKVCMLSMRLGLRPRGR